MSKEFYIILFRRVQEVINLYISLRCKRQKKGSDLYCAWGKIAMHMNKKRIAGVRNTRLYNGILCPLKKKFLKKSIELWNMTLCILEHKH